MTLALVDPEAEDDKAFWIRQGRALRWHIRSERRPMEGDLRASLLSTIQRMTETLGRAEGSARNGEFKEAMVFLAALERDAGGSAEALARTLGALDELDRTRGALDEAYGK